MKTTIKYLAIAFFALTAISCNDDDSSNGNTGNQQKTIAQIAVSDPNLSVLVEALNKTGLTSTFSNPGDYTVFAPTNDKFQAFLSANGFTNLEAVPTPVLAEILKNHVLGKSYTSSQLSTGYVKTLAKGDASSSNTLSMYIDLSLGVKINGGAANGGANVVLDRANIKASNGVIHVVDNVIGLPTVVNHAVANPNFTSLVSTLTSPGQPDFVGILSGTGPFTVFAPTNQAFTNLNAELAAIPLTPTTEQLTTVLKYHVVSGNILSTSLTNNMTVTPLDGGVFTINLTGGAKIIDANNRTSNIIATDVQASNGVIHAIDKVLLPKL